MHANGCLQIVLGFQINLCLKQEYFRNAIRVVYSLDQDCPA